MAEWNAKNFRDIQHSLHYAQECYDLQRDGSSNCNTFTQPSIPVSTLSNGTCPFGSKVCLEGVDTIILDSGMINSHGHLGMNAAPEDQIAFRKVSNCTVLKDTSYTTDWINQSDPSPTQPT